jgi:hypothetical protein
VLLVPLAALFPLLLDVLILVASAQTVAEAAHGRKAFGWRLMAWAGLAGSIGLNAAAAGTPTDVPWYVVAPAVWGFLVELVAADVKSLWKEVHQDERQEAIPIRLWLTALPESTRTWLFMVRLGIKSHIDARREQAVHAIAEETVRRLTGTWRPFARRRARRILLRAVRAQAIDPRSLIAAFDTKRVNPRTANEILKTAVTLILDQGGSKSAGESPKALEAPEAVESPRAPAVAPSRPSRPKPQRGQGRGAVVEELAEEIRSTPGWRPDYPALLQAHGRSRRWAEGIVADARRIAASPRLAAVGEQ